MSDNDLSDETRDLIRAWSKWHAALSVAAAPRSAQAGTRRLAAAATVKSAGTTVRNEARRRGARKPTGVGAGGRLERRGESSWSALVMVGRDRQAAQSQS